MPTVELVQGEARLRELAAAGRWRRSASDVAAVTTDLSRVANAALARLLATYTGTPDRLGAYVLSDGGRPIGLVPCLLQSCPLVCRIGDVRLFQAPLRRMRLFYDVGDWPESPATCDALLAAITDTAGNPGNGAGLPPLDAVCATAVPVDSVLADRLARAGPASRTFRIYRPTPPERHHRIRLPQTFEEYLAGLTSKLRKNTRREARKLVGEAESSSTSGPPMVEPRAVTVESKGIARITNAADVPWLVERMTEISRRTYQYKLLGLGVRDPQRLERDAKAAAELGWLRSYVLIVGGEAIAFIYGLQLPGGNHNNGHGGTYYYLDVGHDPAWSDHSPGTVLQYLAIHDLCDHDRPALFDFGPGDAVHKSRFGNESFLEADFYLFRSTPRAWLARTVHSACVRTSALAGATLGALGLKSRVRRVLRQFASA